ncbi:hypothetical protein [Leptospira bandrabouensis]|uniref:hypothetical protein n=1 Tax=Leptospira bandrabouensis TaxID=2484903 RepID=UPI0010911917|nr:hypothetical protein [Leptospira bandrabouensis]TGN03617.1 hypothetical protein EHR07_17440 [Leptospira bandrabouensis]
MLEKIENTVERQAQLLKIVNHKLNDKLPISMGQNMNEYVRILDKSIEMKDFALARDVLGNMEDIIITFFIVDLKL